jgi:hypothetical protein
MSENSFISIRNATIASVIAGVILLAVPVLRGYVVSFLSWTWAGVVWCWDALVASYSLPGWAWLLIFIFALIGVTNIYLAVKGESEEPEFKSYVEDFMHGAKWRWSWIGNQISNVWCFCPRCDATLVYDDSSCGRLYSGVNKTDFICENCSSNVVASISGGNKDYATGAVEREISRRIRTGEYKKH